MAQETARQEESRGKEKMISTYQFIPGVSTSVSTLKKWVKWCIHLFRGTNDETKSVYKGGWF